MGDPPRTFDLDRFVEAQEGHPGYFEAMDELRAGAKRSHWIWYIFPQLRGLGTSPMAVRYGLDGVEEARAYLRHDLGAGLARAAELVANQIAAGVPLDVLMGSEIDARKVVSSMTLFAHVARDEWAHHPLPAVGVLATRAEEILHAAAAQGYPPCAFTERQISRPDRGPGNDREGPHRAGRVRRELEPTVTTAATKAMMRPTTRGSK